MPSAAWALQSAIFSKLMSDTSVTTLLGGERLYDDVPVRAEFPYITFGQSSDRDWSTGSDSGHEHVVTLHVWSRAKGRRQVDDVAEASRTALHDQTLTLSGHRLINLRHEFTDVRRDGDGETFHGICRYRAVTEAM
jgi:hypothetical protein